LSKKPWLKKSNLEDLYSKPHIKSDTDAVKFFQEQGFEVARRTISDARQKFAIPAKNKKEVVEIEFDDTDLDLDEVWGLVVEMQKALYNIGRQQREAAFTFPKDEPIAIAFMGDVHLGDLGTNYEQIRTDTKLIKETENLYLVCGGDYINNFIKRGKNYNEYEVVQPRVQWKLVEWFFRELEDSIIAIATGNHDAWTEELTQFDALYSIVKNMNFVYTKHGATLDIHLPGNSYKVMFKHNIRAGGGMNPTAAVKQMLRQDGNADIGALFDTHVGAVEEFILEGQWRVAVRTGSYKTQDHWGNAMGFADDVIAAVPVVVLHPQKRYMIPVRSLSQGVSVLNWAREAHENGAFGEADDV
jgi:hypothetical protein